MPDRTPGPLGLNDQGDPNVWSLLGDTPGSVGIIGHSTLMCPLVQVSMARRKLVPAPAATGGPAVAHGSGVPSGAAWVSRYPGSRETSDLEDDFRGKVEAFIAALKAAKASIHITSTLRPPERAYLMHWSWMIVKKSYDPRKVPRYPGVEIAWWHGDLATSRRKAQEMVDGFGIGKLGVPPALKSRHTMGEALDMQVTWAGTLVVKRKDGTTATITSTPRDSTNADLIAVGKTYGVIHFLSVSKDKVHWSTDGH